MVALAWECRALHGCGHDNPSMRPVTDIPAPRTTTAGVSGAPQVAKGVAPSTRHTALAVLQHGHTPHPIRTDMPWPLGRHRQCRPRQPPFDNRSCREQRLHLQSPTLLLSMRKPHQAPHVHGMLNTQRNYVARNHSMYTLAPPTHHSRPAVRVLVRRHRAQLGLHQRRPTRLRRLVA